MSLIMDALEKVQRDTKPQTTAAEWPVMDRPKPAAAVRPREKITKILVEEPIPIRREYGFFVLLFAVLLFAAAVMGFKKISAGLSLQPAPASESTARAVLAPRLAEPGILRGVLQDPAGSFCILGDQILKTGDTWRGYTVLSIASRQVVVQDTQNRLLTLHLQES